MFTQNQTYNILKSIILHYNYCICLIRKDKVLHCQQSIIHLLLKGHCNIPLDIHHCIILITIIIIIIIISSSSSSSSVVIGIDSSISSNNIINTDTKEE